MRTMRYVVPCTCTIPFTTWLITSFPKATVRASGHVARVIRPARYFYYLETRPSLRDDLLPSARLIEPERNRPSRSARALGREHWLDVQVELTGRPQHCEASTKA